MEARGYSRVFHCHKVLVDHVAFARHLPPGDRAPPGTKDNVLAWLCLIQNIDLGAAQAALASR
eukprot:5506818-Pyramimonas_sp.AAC.1